jgi:hypothetical protein
VSEAQPARPRARRFPWAVYWLVFAILVVLTIWPVISVLVASSIAEANGCALDEGSVHPCLVDGADWGEALYTMAVLGWLMLATLPLGGGALLVWLIILIIHRIAWRRRKTMP